MYFHNFAFWSVFVITYTTFSDAEVRLRCGIGSKTNLTFNRSVDGIPGRYTAELCTKAPHKNTNWTLQALINGDDGVYCNQTHHRKYPGIIHSSFEVELNFTQLNCTYVCISTDLDLIFSSCYLLKSTLGKGSAPFDSYHSISNQFNEHNIIAKPHYVVNNYESGVLVHLHPGVPITDYYIEMYNLNSTKSQVEIVTENCTSKQTGDIVCDLSPPYGCYKLVFISNAPWISGLFNQKDKIDSVFCHVATTVLQVPGDSWSIAWVCAAVLGLCAAALAASCAWRTRTAAKIREQVRKTWVENRTVTETALQQNKGSCKNILLLYARECEEGQKAVSLLKELLSQVIPGTVYDIFSPEVMSLAACAPAQWTREVLERADTRVVLLQTPALACLYKAALNDVDSTLRLQEPLLSSRVVQRSPHFGDTLLHYALRLMTETAHHQNAYNKFYLAQLSALKVEVFPQIVRFTRYVLPAATTLLLRDVSSLASWDPPEDVLAEHSKAIADFVDYATENPNYLMEELMFI